MICFPETACYTYILPGDFYRTKTNLPEVPLPKAPWTSGRALLSLIFYPRSSGRVCGDLIQPQTRGPCRLSKHATPQGSSSESATGEHCMYCLSCIQKAMQWLFPMHQLYSQRTWPLMHSIQVLPKCRPPKSLCTSFSTCSWGAPDMEGNDSRFTNPAEVTVSWYWYAPSRVRQAASGYSDPTYRALTVLS